MDKIFAVVVLTYKETIRRKIFLVIGIFTLALIISSALLPSVSPESRVKLVEIWISRSIAFFGMMLAIFLSGVSIPSEIEDRRLYLLLSKPLSRETFLVGKFLGFSLVIALFIVASGLIGLGYLQLVDLITSGRTSNISRPVSVIKAARFGFFSTESVGPTSRTTMEGNLPLRQTADEAATEVTLRGTNNNYAGWSFEGLNPDTVSGLKINARITQGGDQFSAEVDLLITNPLTQANTRQRQTLTYEHPLQLELSRAYIDSLGRVQVNLRRVNPAAVLTVTPESVVLVSVPGSFVWNFAKAGLITFLQILLVLGLVLAGSTILSGGVNIFFGLFLYFIGSTMGFFREALETMAFTMKKVMEESLKTGGHPPVGTETLPVWLMQASQSLSHIFFSILPDLGKFNGNDFLLNGQAIPPETVYSGFSYLLVFLLAALVIGWVGFRSRDFN